MTTTHEAVQLANDRPTSSNDDLYEWSLDAEETLRSQAAEIEIQVRAKDAAIKLWNDAGAEIERKDALLRQVLEFLEFCWRDVSMNEYSFDKLNERIAAIKQHLGDV